MRTGVITIYWEIKDEDGIVAAVEFPPETKRLPYEYRRHIVRRLREMLLPCRSDRRKAGDV